MTAVQYDLPETQEQAEEWDRRASSGGPLRGPPDQDTLPLPLAGHSVAPCSEDFPPLTPYFFFDKDL